ncbi:hypothetical protein PV11_06173 [Exophiala sideris]|uniref:Uncharacterized protein n=1 Tax=Exophiala sideris TaxID=1016849 RepID=A0A0D1X8R3_9EURO|nr:hypothetical protein PV11_06173 [Exophiala sideris]
MKISVSFDPRSRETSRIVLPGDILNLGNLTLYILRVPVIPCIELPTHTGSACSAVFLETGARLSRQRQSRSKPGTRNCADAEVEVRRPEYYNYLASHDCILNSQFLPPLESASQKTLLITFVRVCRQEKIQDWSDGRRHILQQFSPAQKAGEVNSKNTSSILGTVSGLVDGLNIDSHVVGVGLSISQHLFSRRYPPVRVLRKQDKSESHGTEEQKLSKDIDMVDADFKAMENDSQNYMDFEYDGRDIPRQSIEATTDDDDAGKRSGCNSYQVAATPSEVFPGANLN